MKPTTTVADRCGLSPPSGSEWAGRRCKLPAGHLDHPHRDGAAWWFGAGSGPASRLPWLAPSYDAWAGAEMVALPEGGYLLTLGGPRATR